MKFIYKTVIYILILILTIILFSALYLGISNLIICLVHKLVSPDKQDIIQNIINKLPSWSIYSILGFTILSLVLLIYHERRIYKWFKQGSSILCQSLKNIFQSLTTKDWLILLIPFLSSLYFAVAVPVSYDEAMTYNLFTSKPFFYAAIFYPYPNNHVLHSLVTNFFDILPLGHTLFKMRLPAILSNITTWIIALFFLKKYFSQKVAIIAIGLCSVFWMTIFYSFMSRGYAFMVLCVVICFFAFYNIINYNRKRDWYFYIIAAILGTYTIPSFLYPLATINILLLLFKIKDIKKIFISNLIICVVVLILYSPIIFVDGLSALTSNQFVQKIDRITILHGILSFYKGMINEIILGAQLPFFWILLILPLLATLKNYKQLTFWIILGIAPFILIFIHAVNPFFRTFLYYNFFIVFLCITPIQRYLNKIPIRFICVVILTLQLFSVWHFHKTIGSKEGFNTDVHTVVEQYFKNNNTIIFPCIASANYEFEAKVKGMENQILFFNQEKANVDTINGVQFVIIEKERDQTKLRIPFAQSNNQNIYKLD